MFIVFIALFLHPRDSSGHQVVVMVNPEDGIPPWMVKIAMKIRTMNMMVKTMIVMLIVITSMVMTMVVMMME